MAPQLLRNFIEHINIILDLLEKSMGCYDVNDRIWARDVIESMLIIVKEDVNILGDTYLSEALYKAVMTCASDKSEFTDIRSKFVTTTSWYKALSTSSLNYTGDTIQILKALLSESNNNPVNWGNSLRVNYFEIVGMYIHSLYHPISTNMLEHITRVLNSYSEGKTLSADYKSASLSILGIQIDKEHSIRSYKFNNEIDMEYKIRMAIVNANEDMSDDQRRIFEIELEDELEDRKESFTKQLSREKDMRISVLETQLNNVGSNNEHLLTALKNMTSIVLKRLTPRDNCK